MAGGQAGPKSIEVLFCGERRKVEVGGELTFGRQADLVLDDNRFLHRVVGRIHMHAGVWWLDNVGSEIPIVIADSSSASHVRLAPGASAAIPFANALVQFSGAQIPYELELNHMTIAPKFTARAKETYGVATVHAANLRFNDEQRLLLVALALPYLREPHRPDRALPMNREVAARLGWEITKFNRKLDYICRRMTDEGFRGLLGGPGNLAGNRRILLVRYVVDGGLITLDDVPAGW